MSLSKLQNDDLPTEDVFLKDQNDCISTQTVSHYPTSQDISSQGNLDPLPEQLIQRDERVDFLILEACVKNLHTQGDHRLDHLFDVAKREDEAREVHSEKYSLFNLVIKKHHNFFESPKKSRGY
jgi:hypothetical protein